MSWDATLAVVGWGVLALIVGLLLAEWFGFLPPQA